jgi:hypothetical protein
VMLHVAMNLFFEKKSRNEKTTTHKTDFLIATTYEVVS